MDRKTLLPAIRTALIDAMGPHGGQAMLECSSRPDPNGWGVQLDLSGVLHVPTLEAKAAPQILRVIADQAQRALDRDALTERLAAHCPDPDAAAADIMQLVADVLELPPESFDDL